MSYHTTSTSSKTATGTTKGRSPTKVSSTTWRTTIFIRYPIQQRANALPNGRNLLGGTLNLQNSAYLIDMHLCTGTTLHGNNGGAATTNNNANMIAQFHFIVENFRCLFVLFAITL